MARNLVRDSASAEDLGEEAGLTQEELAKLMGRSQRFISYCETGERRVDAIEFLDFCKALGKPPSWFVKGWPR